MTERRYKAAWAGVVLLIHSLSASPAWAEDSVQLEKASVLFSEGRTLMAEGRYGEACERFEQSLGHAQGIGTRFNLANCWEVLGRTASAQSLFLVVAAAAETEGQSDRAKVARERAAALEPRLSRLVIDVESPAPGTTVVSNRAAVETSSWGVPVAVDPGPYQIEATAPGKLAWSKRIVVTASRSLIWVGVPVLADDKGHAAGLSDASGAAGTDASQSASPAEPAPTPVTARRSENRAVKPVALGLSAVALAGIAAGTVFALKYDSSNADAQRICAGASACTRDNIEEYQQLTSDARAARLGAYLSFGLGGAALVGAAVTYFGFSVPRSEGATSLTARPIVTDSGTWGLAAQGSF